MRLTYNKANLILAIVLFFMIVPTIRFFGFETPFIYLLTPIGIIVFVFIIFGWISIPFIVKPLIVLWLLVLVQILLSTFYSTINKLGYFSFPTDIIQYVVRFVFLISFIVFAFKGKISKEKFIKYFLVTLTAGMLIGVLQWISWPGRELFIKLYPYRDGLEQISQLNRALYAIRMHGLAQFATANGGLASFAFAYAYSIRKYYKRHRNLTMLLMILSVVNIFASQARAGMLALVFSIILFYFVDIKYERKGLKSTAYFIAIIASSSLILTFLYYRGNEFIVRNVARWVRLIEEGGGSRMTQPQYFFSMMNGSDYLFGLSKPIINRTAITFGVEIEPINIFVTYGLVGFILQYSIVILLLAYFYKKINKIAKDKAILSLLIASFVSLFSYQIFSVAYYFFREIRVGLFPWVLMGVAIGIYERERIRGEKI